MLQFLEEAVRECRGELVVRGPVYYQAVQHRVNKLISKVQQVMQAVHKSAPYDSAAVERQPLADLDVKSLTQLFEEALDGASLVDSVRDSVPVAAWRPEAAAVPDKPSTEPQLTYEQAKAASQSCSKCRFQGCSVCMGGWLLKGQ